MNILILGRRRKGKSTLAMHLARDNSDSVVIFDPNSQYKNYPIASNSIELENLIFNKDENAKEDVIVFQPVGEPEDEWNLFAEIMWSQGGYVLIIDEAHNLQKPNYLNKWLSRFIRQAPTESDGADCVHIIQTLHRPSDTATLVRSQATDLYIFKTTLARDLDVICSEYGEDVALAVSNLDGRDFVHYNVDTEKMEIVKDSGNWFEKIRNSESENKLEKKEENKLLYA